jgi:hypothetical protein
MQCDEIILSLKSFPHNNTYLLVVPTKNGLFGTLSTESSSHATTRTTSSALLNTWQVHPTILPDSW